MEKEHDQQQELRKLEKVVKIFYEYAPLPYHCLDENIKILDVNQAWLDFFGYDKEDVIGRYFGEFLVLKSEELLKSRFSQFKEVGVTRDKEYEIVKKNGIHRTILLDGRIEYDNNNKIKQTHCFFKDITERKQTEEKLKESEEKFRNITEQSFMSIYIIQDGLIVYRNQRANDVSGYSKEDVKNFKPFEYAKIIHPEDRERVLEQSRKKQRGETDVINRYKYRLLKKSGEIAWIDNFSKTINYRGRPADLVITEEITQKIVSEQKLKKSEEKYRTLIENMPDTIYSSLPDEFNSTLFLSKRWEDWTGIPIDNYFKNPKLFFETIHPDDHKKTRKIYKEALKNGTGFILNYRVKHKDTGKEIYIRDHGVPIKNERGEIVSYNGIMTNVTDLKKAENDLKESETLFKKAYDKADFYKDLLAHDVSNIFNNINASIQLIELWKEDSEMSGNKEDMIAIIKQQLERGASLVSNVRKLSELEEGDRLIKSVDVINVINNSIKNIRTRFQDKVIDIKVEKTNETLNIKGGDLLIDAFENILINASLHNENDMIKIWIKVSEVCRDDEKFAKIEFKDNGIGIIDSRKKTIFERNYKNDRSTGGMGIGLSLVKTIINSYDGQVMVDNRVMGDHTKGSIFIILLKLS